MNLTNTPSHQHNSAVGRISESLRNRIRQTSATTAVVQRSSPARDTAAETIDRQQFRGARESTGATSPDQMGKGRKRPNPCSAEVHVFRTLPHVANPKSMGPKNIGMDGNQPRHKRCTPALPCPQRSPTHRPHPIPSHTSSPVNRRKVSPDQVGCEIPSKPNKTTNFSPLHNDSILVAAFASSHRRDKDTHHRFDANRSRKPHEESKR